MPDAGRLLSVDDDDATRYVRRRVLESAGFAVVDAASGAEALERAIDLSPDVVLLDVHLGDMTGFDVARRLRADERTRALPVLQVSAIARDATDRATGLESGADMYLSEPIEPYELVAAVRGLIRMRDAERAAMRLAAQWATTFDAIGDAVVLFDEAGRVQRANAAMGALLGRSPTDLVGWSHEDVADAALGARSALRFEAVMRRGERGSAELRRDDRAFHVTLDPIRSEGAVTGAVGVIADISDRVRASDERDRLFAEAQRALALRDDFLSVAAHELRTPLTSLTLALGLVRRRIDDVAMPAAKEAVVPYLARMSASVRHLALLVDELLHVARSGSLAGRTCPEQIDLGDFVREVARGLDAELSASGSSLEVRPGGDVSGTWPRKDLEHVVTNLLSNAIKYGRGRPIEVRARGDAASVRLSVRDQGIGIELQDQQRIFERFERAADDPARTGFGLGLWIVKTTVDALGGRVSVRSAAGKGSTFTVELPRAPIADAKNGA